MNNERHERIEQRKRIIEVLANENASMIETYKPFWYNLRLVQLALDGPVKVNLDFMLAEFPGLYLRQMKDLLTSLKALGIVKIDYVNENSWIYELDLQDELTKGLIETLVA